MTSVALFIGIFSISFAFSTLGRITCALIVGILLVMPVPRLELVEVRILSLTFQILITLLSETFGLALWAAFATILISFATFAEGIKIHRRWTSVIKVGTCGTEVDVNLCSHHFEAFAAISLKTIHVELNGWPGSLGRYL